MKSKELLENRAKLLTDLRSMNEKIVAEERDFNAEENEQWEAKNQAVQSLDKDIVKAQRSEQLESLTARQDDLTPQYRAGKNATPDQEKKEARLEYALQGFMRRWSGKGLSLTHRQSEAARQMGYNLESNSFDITLPARPTYRNYGQALQARTLHGQSGVTGGFLRPEDYIPRLEKAMVQFGGILNVAEVFRTNHGNDCPWPFADDTANSGYRLGTPLAADVNAADPSFKQKIFHAYGYTSGEICVDNFLLEDSAFDLSAYMAEWIGERFGRIWSSEFTNGASGGPEGLIPTVSSGVTAASATAIAADEIKDLMASIDPAYFGPDCKFMGSSTTLWLLRKLKDGNGRYLLQDDFTSPEGTQVCGFQYVQNQQMPAATNALKPLVFGKLDKIKVRMVNAITIKKLEERKALSNQTSWVAFARGDCCNMDLKGNAIKALTMG